MLQVRFLLLLACGLLLGAAGSPVTPLVQATTSAGDGGLCFTYDSVNPTQIYVGSCSSPSTFYTTMWFNTIFAVSGTLTSTQASYLSNPGQVSTISPTSNQQSSQQAQLSLGSTKYYRIDAKSDFNSGSQIVTLSEAFYVLPYNQASISTSSNNFYGDSGTGSSLGSETAVCLVPSSTPNTCGSPITYTPGSTKYSLFVRFSGTNWKTTGANNVAYTMRQSVSITGYSVYFNGNPSLTGSNIGTVDITSVTYVPNNGANVPSFSTTFPTTFLTGSLSTTGSGAATAINMGAAGMLYPTGTGTVHIKVSLQGGQPTIDFNFLTAEVPCVTAGNDASCNCYFVYDPTVTRITASSSNALSTGGIVGVAVGVVAFAVLLTAVVIVVIKKKHAKIQPANHASNETPCTGI